MNPFEVTIAALREWQGADERFERLAQASRGTYYYLGPPDNQYTLPLPKERIDAYLSEWARSFISEPFQRLTDDELSIRHAVQERVVLESDEMPKSYRECVRDQLADIEREIERRRRKAGT